MPVSFFTMAKQPNSFKRFLSVFRIPILAGDTTAKFLFLLLSIFLWFLIKLSNEGYVTELTFPVNYTNVPTDKRLNETPVSKVTVRVRSVGFDLLKYKLRSLRPLEVDLSDVARTDEGSSYWATNSRRNFLNEKFDANTQIVSITPDTVFFDFNDVVSKKIKVYLKARKKFSNFKTFYRPPSLTPDSITVVGSEQQLSEMDSIFTKPVNLKAEEDSVEIGVPLDLPKGSDLEFSEKRVTLKVRYSSLTEGTFEVPIKVVNLPEDYELNIFPDHVDAKFQVAVEDYDRVSVEEFEAYVNFNEISEQTDKQVMTVRLETTPAFLKGVTINPKQVEYILIRK